MPIPENNSTANNRRRVEFVILHLHDGHAGDANGLEHVLFEPVLRRPYNKIRPQATRLKGPLHRAAVALAAVLEGEKIAGADNLAFHTADLANPLDAANPVTHPLNLYDDVEGAGDLRPQ